MVSAFPLLSFEVIVVAVTHGRILLDDIFLVRLE